MITSSGNRTARGMISTILTEASWEAMWEIPCDHLTLDRQREVARMVQAVWNRIENRDSDGAEREIRLFHESHRDAVLKQLSIRRKQSIDPARLVTFAQADTQTGQTPDLESRLDRLEQLVSRLSQPTA